ncbi:MAG: hypothetical protein ABEJ05_12075 [Haloglomus sp.]
MGVLSKLRRLLGLLEGHEDEVAAQVSKRTGVSKEQAKKGIETVTDLADTGSSDGPADRGSN